MKCKRCNSEHDGSFGSGKFCSRACANSRDHSDNTRQKISESAKMSEKVRQANIERNKKRWSNNEPVSLENRRCPICKTGFTCNSRSNKTFCSQKCRIADTEFKYRKRPPGGPGGYRKGSGRGKSGYYKGIWCDSTYELVWVIYRLDHNLSVDRFKGFILYDSNKKYYPDFIDGNKITEIKGYVTDSVLHKTEAALDNGYEIEVLTREDLTEQFDWVKENYRYKNIQELYDQYKPQYTYTCCGCNTTFQTETRKRTERVFCSRSCITPIKTKLR
jgi:hypothetical protein